MIKTKQYYTPSPQSYKNYETALLKKIAQWMYYV